jgi:anti-sigma regulatory factor (Ser/Thr protein kinase)
MINNTTTLSLPVTDTSDVSAARRNAIAYAQRWFNDDQILQRIALIITELATNLIKHTPSGGELLLQPSVFNNMLDLYILSLDKGPGMSDITQCLQDGYSTRDSSGTGLGAISRLADALHIYSLPEYGTVLFAHIKDSGQPISTSDRTQVASLYLPKLGQKVSGDAWTVQNTDGHIRLVLTDGNRWLRTWTRSGNCLTSRNYHLL